MNSCNTDRFLATTVVCGLSTLNYIFRKIFPFHRKDKIATCLLLPPAVFLSPPTFWEARDQPEPGSFFPRMKDPGNEVGFLAPECKLRILFFFCFLLFFCFLYGPRASRFGRKSTGRKLGA